MAAKWNVTFPSDSTCTVFFLTSTDYIDDTKVKSNVLRCLRVSYKEMFRVTIMIIVQITWYIVHY